MNPKSGLLGTLSRDKQACKTVSPRLNPLIAPSHVAPAAEADVCVIMHVASTFVSMCLGLAGVCSQLCVLFVCLSLCMVIVVCVFICSSDLLVASAPSCVCLDRYAAFAHMVAGVWCVCVRCHMVSGCAQCGGGFCVCTTHTHTPEHICHNTTHNPTLSNHNNALQTTTIITNTTELHTTIQTHTHTHNSHTHTNTTTHNTQHTTHTTHNTTHNTTQQRLP